MQNQELMPPVPAVAQAPEASRQKTMEELRSTAPEIRMQEDRQGWIHLPCGDHGLPWRADVVAMLQEAELAQMTPCQHVQSRTLPSIGQLVRFSRRLGDHEGFTADPVASLPEQVQFILAKRATGHT